MRGDVDSQRFSYVRATTARVPSLRAGRAHPRDESARLEVGSIGMDYSGWSGMGAFAPVAQKRYGGFWVRVVAYFLDAILLVIAQVILMQVIESKAQQQVINFLLTWFYFAGLESMAGATLGKMVLGLSVTDDQGNNISFLRATGRYFAKIISALILCIGYLMVAWDGQKQGLHDKIAGTLVVRN
jgi:uncharacterized RDD family membrane protein YckC